ncbi:lipocalin-like domain-containing protein [Amycolatopsis sp. K13G38]|uniref:Lipocalin-like domain-containing protein n=1 Tax=Amycolatopsis acididurans TaxID=2724524 RepID=A0ABX1JAD7_9PSEU|nr:lipocalin-like domain-containing protein [Amycolatopsis acididurans]NKQ56743.1 lipocalin-like domain-containing protein [Amycolatopsis acididurans]
MTTVEQLHGTWDLLDFVRVVDGNPVGDVLGPRPVGRLSYQPDGRVTALLMRRNREWRAGAGFLTADDKERGAAALGFVGYGGRFELRGDQVVHHLDISLYPEHPGTDLVRTVRWEAGLLVLSTEQRLTRSGRTMWDELTWRRLGMT